MLNRRLSLLDQCICNADALLKTITSQGYLAERASPSAGHRDTAFSESERKHVAGLMRVNHAGEVCAQALYQGQALTAKLPAVRQEMEQAAREEVDHLVWCEERLQELDSHTSYLNPAWFGISFTLGALAGAIGDKVRVRWAQYQGWHFGPAATFVAT